MLPATYCLIVDRRRAGKKPAVRGTRPIWTGLRHVKPSSGMAVDQCAAGDRHNAKTVDAHRARIMDRLGIHDIASLTRFAVKHGLVKV